VCDPSRQGFGVSLATRHGWSGPGSLAGDIGGVLEHDLLPLAAQNEAKKLIERGLSGWPGACGVEEREAAQRIGGECNVLVSRRLRKPTGFRSRSITGITFTPHRCRRCRSSRSVRFRIPSLPWGATFSKRFLSPTRHAASPTLRIRWSTNSRAVPGLMPLELDRLSAHSPISPRSPHFVIAYRRTMALLRVTSRRADRG